MQLSSGNEKCSILIVGIRASLTEYRIVKIYCNKIGAKL